MNSLSVCFFSLIASLILIAGCTQQAPSSRFESHDVSADYTQEDLGTQSKDEKPKAAPAEASGQPAAGAVQAAYVPTQSSPAKRLSVGHADNSFENILRLHEYAAAYKLRSLEANLLNQLAFLYENSSSGYIPSADFSTSPYADLFITQSKPQFMSSTASLHNDFDVQKTIIINSLGVMRSDLLTLPADLPLKDSIQIMANQLANFETRLQQSPSLMPAIRDSIRAELSERFWMKLPEAQALLSQYSNSTQLESAIHALTQFMGKFEVQLSPSEVQRIESGRQLGQTLAAPLSDRETLAMLIEVWESLEPAEREKAFADTSPELHKFLSSKSEEKRECLKRPDCKNIFMRFARGNFILPKLRKYGLDRIQAQVNSAGIQTLDASARQAARATLVSLPDRLQTEIFAEMDKELNRITGYRGNYDAFARSELQLWFETKFQRKTLPTVPQKRIEFSPPLRLSVSGDRFDPETFANNLIALTALMKGTVSATSNRANAFGLTLANQILSHGGFNLESGRASPSLLVVQNRTVQPINIQQFNIPRGQIGYSSARGVTLSVAQRSALLRGFRKLVTFLADWKTSAWDQSIKNIKVADLFTNIPAQTLKQPALPKDAFLALAVGNMSALLYDLQRPEGPLFYMCPERTIAWLGKGQSCASPTTLLSVSDLPISNSPTVQAKDHARFLIEVVEFLKLTNEINKTRSSYLTRGSRSKPSPVELLRANKTKLTELGVALSNFLSHVLVSEDGQVCQTYQVKSQTCTNSQASLSHYASAVRALSLSSKHFGIEAYAVVAKVIFAKLNSQALGANGFYVANATAVDYAEGLSILESIKSIDSSPEMIAIVQPLEARWRRRMQSAAGL